MSRDALILDMKRTRQRDRLGLRAIAAQTAGGNGTSTRTAARQRRARPVRAISNVICAESIPYTECNHPTKSALCAFGLNIALRGVLFKASSLSSIFALSQTPASGNWSDEEL